MKLRTLPFAMIGCAMLTLAVQTYATSLRWGVWSSMLDPYGLRGLAVLAFVGAMLNLAAWSDREGRVAVLTWWSVAFLIAWWHVGNAVPH